MPEGAQVLELLVLFEHLDELLVVPLADLVDGPFDGDVQHLLARDHGIDADTGKPRGLERERSRAVVQEDAGVAGEGAAAIEVSNDGSGTATTASVETDAATTEENIAHILDHDDFEFLEHDVTRPFEVLGTIDNVLHFASPASPIDYLELPIQTLKVGSLGTHN